MGLGKVLESGFNLLKVRTMTIWLKIGIFFFLSKIRSSYRPTWSACAEYTGLFLWLFWSPQSKDL